MPGRGYIFVLWADNFEEVAAAIFISELREAGLKVKMVGLTGPRSRGAHGLVLVPDLTLDQALPLASQTRCLVIPCAASTFKSLKNDPRLQHFFEQLRAVQACLVINATFPLESLASDLGAFPAKELILVYPDNQEMVKFTQELVDLLVNN